MVLTRGRITTGLSVVLLLGVAAAALLVAQDADGPPLSPRNANYTIEVRLDPETRILTGRQVLEWRNRTQEPASELWFHLYWNAWKNTDSTWLRENRLAPRGPRRVRKDGWAYSRVTAMRVLPQLPFAEEDLAPTMRFVAPDDGNPDDQTVLVAPLTRYVWPGDTVRVEIEFEAKIPRTFARTGYRGDYFFLAQWFPKLAVFEADGTWNSHQFHRPTEFYSDYGVYDVQMTVPTGWVVGATGVEQSQTGNDDGTTTHRYRQADVHDFAWTTSPDFLTEERMFEYEGLNPVRMRFLYQPEHAGQVDRHFKATETALKYYGLWYGEYPYEQVTFVDPAWGSGSGGMEYPTFFTCGTAVWNPFGSGRPEGVTIHEAGHQFWYGIVGNNEFEHAWIDEGLNTFSTARAQTAEYGASMYTQRFFKGFLPVMIPEIVQSRILRSGMNRYRQNARREVQATPTYLYHPASASSITYSKTALWLLTLENLLGWETFQPAMSEFFNRWKFRHPEPDDFFAVFNEVSGQDLSWFFDQVYRQEVAFDFAVDRVSSAAVETKGYADRDGEPEILEPADDDTDSADETQYETRVVVRRVEDGRLPVEVLIVFEDGEEIHESWDAAEKWKEFTYVRPSKLAYAAVDPDHKLVLDLNVTNNSMRLAPQSKRASTKWVSKWMVWVQDYLHTLSALI